MSTRIWTITGTVAGLTAMTVGGVFLANAMLNPPQATDPFVATEAQDILIVQQSSSTYDVSFTLPEGLSSSDVAIELTKIDEYADAQPLDAVVDDGRAYLADLPLEAGDHFLWISDGGDPVSTPITIPDMSPFIWLDGDVPNLQFNQEGRSSWSSYVDPEGKNVFRSSAPVFDETAQPLAENLPITETAFRDPSPTPESPYYYLVFSGKGGEATFVSSSMFSSANQGSVAVDFENRGGEPFVIISGEVFAKQEAVDRELSLRVGNFDPADPTATFMVENAITEENSTRFRFEVPAANLRPGSSNLALFLAEDGTMLEWSIRAPEVDMSRSLQVGQSVYGVTNPDALQLTRFDLAYDRVSLTLRESGGVPYLFVSGRFAGDYIGSGTPLIVKDSTGEAYTVADRDNDPARFSFGFALDRLTKPTIWYDIEFVHPETGAVSPVMADDVADFRQWIQVDNRTYALADFQGTTKVFFERYPFANASVTKQIINGVPMLVASGTLIDAAPSDAFMRIRTGDTTIGDVRNLTSRPGQFLFQFPLSRLAEPGVWYDVVFGLSSNGSLRDFPTTAVADMAATLAAGERIYSYREWNGQLKVAFERSIGDIALTAGEFVEVDGTPVLRLTGTLSGLAQSDAFLRLRSGAETYDSPNLATTAGEVRFDVDLSVLTKAGTWYDVVVGNVPEGSFTDALPEIVDMAQTLTVDGRTYDFRQFDGQLKVNFAPTPAISVTSASVVDVDGVATLRVVGTAASLPVGAGVLEVATSEGAGQQVIVTNSSVTAGEVLFELDLTDLTEATRWYNLKVGASVDALSDLRTPAVSTSPQWDNGGGNDVRIGDRLYGFREFYSDLKINFSAAPTSSVTVSSASVVDVDGVATLRVVGTTAGLPAGGGVLQVATNGGAGQQLLVSNSSVTAGQALFELDLTDLTVAGSWYDLKAGVSADALNDLETPAVSTTPAWNNDGVNDVRIGDRLYGFREYFSDLKINFSAAPTSSVTVSSASVVDVDGVATLRVVGTTAGLPVGGGVLQVATSGGAGQQLVVSNSSETAGQALFELDLTELTVAGSWYDLKAGVSVEALADLKTPAVSTSPEWNNSGANDVQIGDRLYGFREFWSDLKINFSAAPAGSATVTSASIVDVDGVATLRVVGTVTGLAADDVYLRIRSGDEIVDVPNSSPTAGVTLFTQDLSVLTKTGTWYDLLLGITSTDTRTDLVLSVVGDGSLDYSRLNNGEYDGSIAVGPYTFREYYGLKVTRVF